MILTGNDILRLIVRGVLRIEPLDPTRVREQLQPAGIDLRIADRYCVMRGGPVIQTWSILNVGVDDHYYCNESDTIALEPGNVYLLHTIEKVCLPNDIVGLVTLRSTFARLGLVMPPTVVDPGFCGQLTLELYNASRSTIMVRRGQRLVQLVLMITTSPSEPYSGRYQHQTGVTLPRLPA